MTVTSDIVALNQWLPVVENKVCRKATVERFQ